MLTLSPSSICLLLLAVQPRLNDRLEMLRNGTDPSARSSPLGTALMMRKMANAAQRRAPESELCSERLPGMDMWCLEGQLHAPALRPVPTRKES